MQVILKAAELQTINGGGPVPALGTILHPSAPGAPGKDDNPFPEQLPYDYVPGGN